MPRWKNALHTSTEIRRLKREAVLKEAGRAFAQKGYHNTSLDDVAEALQVSKGTLYNYVKDKQEILYELHKISLDIAEEAFAEARVIGGTGADQLRNVLRRHVFRFTQELGACVVLMDIDALRDKERIEIIKRREGFHKAFVSIIEEGIKDGSIRKVDPSLAVFSFMGTIYWLPRWYSPKGKLTGEQLADALADLILSGLVPNVPTTSSAKTTKPRKKPALAG